MGNRKSLSFVSFSGLPPWFLSVVGFFFFHICANAQNIFLIIYIKNMMHKHQAWIFEVGPDYLLFKLPMDSEEVEDIIQDAVKFVKSITADMEEDIHLYMENKDIVYQGNTLSCIVVYSAEFPIGVIIFNASLSKTNQVGPYCVKNKKMYTTWHKETPEA